MQLSLIGALVSVKFQPRPRAIAFTCYTSTILQSDHVDFKHQIRETSDLCYRTISNTVESWESNLFRDANLVEQRVSRLLAPIFLSHEEIRQCYP